MIVCILAEKDDAVDVPGAVYGPYTTTVHVDGAPVDVLDEGWYVEVETLEQILEIMRDVGASLAYGYEEDSDTPSKHPFLLVY